MEILKVCPLPLKLVLAKLSDSRTSPNKTLRLAVIEALSTILQASAAENLNEHEDAITRIVKDGLQDAAEPVRAASKTLFRSFAVVFPASSESYKGLDSSSL